MAEGDTFDATNRLCDFIVGFQLDSGSEVLRRRAKDLLADTFGVTIAAAGDEVAHVVGQLHAGDSPCGPMSLIGHGSTQSAGAAAFHNGALAHALEFDDSTLNPVGHPSCVIVPALFALAEKTQASGRAFLEAYIVGLEIHSRLGQAELGGWSAGGFWLPIGHVSLLGAAAACAKLLQSNRFETEQALGLAAHFSGGLAVSNGSLAKPIGSGASARAALEAAMLAKAGATAPAQVVERPQGFADVFLGPGHDLAKALAKLGAPHHLEEIGIAIKRYPSCYATHWGVDALLLLIAEHDLRADDIEAIVLEHPASGAFCDNPDPTNTEEARFSHEYNLSVAVLDGVPGPASYTAERLAKPDVRDFLKRVRTRNHADELAPPKAWEYLVTVTTGSGKVVSRAVPRPLGHPRHPMSTADLQAKVFTCVEPVLGADQTGLLLKFVDEIETLSTLSHITSVLSNIRTPHVGRGT